MDSNRDEHRGTAGSDRPPRRIRVRQTEWVGRDSAAPARPAGTAERRGTPRGYGGGVQRPPAPAAPAAPAPPANAAAGGAPSLPTRRYIIIGAGTLVALLCVLFIVFSQPRAKCPGASKLKGPKPGSPVTGAFTLGVSVENRRCVSAVTYRIDGEDVATEMTFPYEVVLNAQTLSHKLPKRETHEVTAVVEDTSGETRQLEDKLTLTFSAAAGSASREASEPAPEASGPDPEASPARAAAPAAAAIPAPGGRHKELSAQCAQLASQISGKSGYTFAPEFTILVEQRLSEYRGVRASEMARRYRSEINKAFDDVGVSPMLGYVLAFSRSKFDLNENDSGLGLWQMSPNLARSSNYLTAEESDASLKDPRRSAEVAAFYLKDLLTSFDTEDFMYAVACFGMGVNEAGRLSARLHEVAPNPASRRDIIRMSKAGVITPAQLDRVARFFAAGIIGEHPHSFNQKDGQTFSSLYY